MQHQGSQSVFRAFRSLAAHTLGTAAIVAGSYVFKKLTESIDEAASAEPPSPPATAKANVPTGHNHGVNKAA